MTPFSLQKWIDLAAVSVSEEDYLERAASVALELTKTLRLEVGRNNKNCAQIKDGSETSVSCCYSNTNEVDSVDSDGDGDFMGLLTSADGDGFSFVPIQIEDIVADNVRISAAGVNLVATEVKIHPSSCKSYNDFFEPPQMLERDACFALGMILFKLFSRQDFSPLLDIKSVDENEIISFDDLSLMFEGDGLDFFEDSTPLPALKKSSQSSSDRTLATSSDKAMKAKGFLEEQGLPRSICKLVSDLLEAETGNHYQSVTALLSLGDAQYDLAQMRLHPQRFLHGDTCPEKALERTELLHQTDAKLFGRENEMNTLMSAASRVSTYVSDVGQNISNHALNPSMMVSDRGQDARLMQGSGFLCEAVFLSGHSGSGKSSVVKHLVSFCTARDWFVLQCNFDRKSAPLSTLLQSFNAFFGKLREALDHDTFDRISHSIITSANDESFCQLCEVLPNLCELFPFTQRRKKPNNPMRISLSNASQRNTEIASTVGVGSGNNRLIYLLNIVFKAICKGGHPVAIITDDLQWSDAFSMEIIADFIQTARFNSEFSSSEQMPQGGLLFVGSFRDNEVDEDGFLIKQIKSMEQSSVKVNRLFVGELSEHKIHEMISDKLCLPPRYTGELAQLVHSKTRGFPMYTIEFLKSIIQSNLLTFSVKSRQWIWDEALIETQMISEGVVALLTRKLQQLPKDVIGSLKVASCFGQINMSTIKLLDLEQFVPDLQNSLDLAVKEGILEKAGPIFAFSHDMLQESSYELIPLNERNFLHKTIAMSLARDPEIANDAELCTIAVDQLMICNDMSLLKPLERALFAKLNLVAGKNAMGASSYQQARGYFESGISFLTKKAWDKQYFLCLELHEMSVVVSFMDGQVETVSSRLDAILANAMSFDDALKSRTLRAKFLASQAQYADATNEMLDVLATLGETFPKDADLTFVTNEVNAAQQLLTNITKEKFLSLPMIEDIRKLNAMKCMGLLVTFGHCSSPMLVPLLCCRMIKMTFEFGYCEDSISALAFVSYALTQYLNDSQLASRIVIIAEALMCNHPNEHALRAKLTAVATSARVYVQPFQAAADCVLKGYNSARIVGDVGNAVQLSVGYCVVHLFSKPDLIGFQQYMVNFFHLMAKYKQLGLISSVMSFFDAVTHMIGNVEVYKIDMGIEVKKNKELCRVAEQTQSTYLMHHTIINRMHMHFYFREYVLVVGLAEEYRKIDMGENKGTKRVLDWVVVFFGGISALCLARDTKKEKWRKIGEESVKTMKQLLGHSTWNFENKLHLLQAELHYTNKCNNMARILYQSAIESANNHKLLNEEALAHELYGAHLVETNMTVEGIGHLRLSAEKYAAWGAMKKANAVWDLIDLVNQPLHLWKCTSIINNLIPIEIEAAKDQIYSYEREQDFIFC